MLSSSAVTVNHVIQLGIISVDNGAIIYNKCKAFECVWWWHACRHNVLFSSRIFLLLFSVLRTLSVHFSFLYISYYSSIDTLPVYKILINFMVTAGSPTHSINSGRIIEQPQRFSLGANWALTVSIKLILPLIEVIYATVEYWVDDGDGDDDDANWWWRKLQRQLFDNCMMEMMMICDGLSFRSSENH